MSFYNPDQYTEKQSGLEPDMSTSPAATVTAVKAANPTEEQELVISEVADWIDADVIACVIAEELADNGTPVTLENCQRVWLKVLEDLHEEVRSAIPNEF